MSLCCPDCYVPVNVALHAREGRCDECRPKRRHSRPRVEEPNAGLTALMNQHNRRNYTQ